MSKHASRSNQRSTVSGKKGSSARHQKRSGTKSKSVFLRKPAVWLGGLATAVLAAVLAGVLTPSAQSVFNSNPAISRLPKLPVPQQDLCAKFRIDIQCTFNVLDPGSYVTAKPFSSYQKIPICNSPAMPNWTERNTFPYLNRFLLEISSSTRAAVDVANLQASIIKQYSPLRTAILECAGGQAYSLYVEVKLDTNPPTVTYYCGDTPCAFPTFTLQMGDVIKIYIYAFSMKHFTEWRGRFNLIVNGRAYELDLGYHYVTSESEATRYCLRNGSTWIQCLPNLSDLRRPTHTGRPRSG